ncbi:MAG: helix-turn-helix transcriptional regulator, partial [Alphaproteobacteria bacterium]|nr:helix-turn-helix transcriptional regulator [Alphaproteobacteria bacterium]
LYINNLELIENFIVYFKSKSKGLFDFNDKRKMFIYQEDRSLIYPELNVNADYTSFLKDIKPTHYNLFQNYRDLHLTPHEFFCLQLFSNGKSIKEIAQLKNISFRTVEAHLSNIRKKLGNDGYKDIKKIFNESIYSKMNTDNFFK